MILFYLMGIRSVTLLEGEFYHVYNRGTDKRLLFQDMADYQRFIKLLYVSNSIQSINIRNILRKNDNPYTFERGDPLVSIGAYCLMPNHFHILLTPTTDDGVSRFMKKLGTAYSMYFNKRYNRTGTLFEGPFKAKWVDDDIYLKYLFAYIHLNPLKLWGRGDVLSEPSGEETLTFLQSYSSSSLPDYLQLVRPENVIINPTPFPEYFKTVADQVVELKDWLTFKEESDFA